MARECVCAHDPGYAYYLGMHRLYDLGCTGGLGRCRLIDLGYTRALGYTRGLGYTCDPGSCAYVTLAGM